jgi:hypothetical protein
MVGGRRWSGSRPDSRLGLAWPAVTYAAQATAQKPGEGKKKKNEEDDGSDLVFLSYFLKIQ